MTDRSALGHPLTRNPFGPRAGFSGGFWFEILETLRRPAVRPWIILLTAMMVGGTTWLDVATGPGREPAAFYDIPILLAAVMFGIPSAVATATASITLFGMTLWYYRETWTVADVAQALLFMVLGIVMAKLVDEYRRATRLQMKLHQINAELDLRVMEAVGAEREAQERLRASERLAALGEAARPPLDIVVGETARLELLLRDLLDLSRPASCVSRPVALDHLFSEVLVLAQPPADEQGVYLDFQCSQELPYISGDEDLLKRALLNVALNGIQAMPGGGSLTITVHLQSNGGAPGLEIIFHDTGAGIPPACIGKIFEPFFTTKKDGTGLGLSIVKQTVEQHGGAVEVASAPGAGTSVTIHLPVH